MAVTHTHLQSRCVPWIHCLSVSPGMPALSEGCFYFGIHDLAWEWIVLLRVVIRAVKLTSNQQLKERDSLRPSFFLITLLSVQNQGSSISQHYQSFREVSEKWNQSTCEMLLKKPKTLILTLSSCSWKTVRLPPRPLSKKTNNNNQQNLSGKQLPGRHFCEQDTKMFPDVLINCKEVGKQQRTSPWINCKFWYNDTIRSHGRRLLTCQVRKWLSLMTQVLVFLHKGFLQISLHIFSLVLIALLWRRPNLTLVAKCHRLMSVGHHLSCGPSCQREQNSWLEDN